MEVLFGLCGKDFVICGGDTSVIRSITVLKCDESKSRQLNKHNIMYYSGEAGDTVHFAEFIQKNVQLFHYTNNGQDLDTPQVASFTRRQLAESLRSRVNLLIAGWSKEHGPKLYWQDYLAASSSVPYACQGYGAYYLNSLLDRHHTEDLDVEGAVKIIRQCLGELQTRFIANLPKFRFQIIDSEGARDIEI